MYSRIPKIKESVYCSVLSLRELPTEIIT